MKGRKINIKLPKQLATKLDAYSRNEGLTKSKLIRHWLIHEPQLLLVPAVTGEEQTSYSFWLDEESYNGLLLRAKSYDVGISQYLRLLFNNLVNENELQGKQINQLKDNALKRTLTLSEMWHYGEVDQIIAEGLPKLDELATHELFLVARSCFIVGQNQQAQQILELFRSKISYSASDSLEHAQYYLLAGTFASSKRNIPNSMQLLRRALVIAKDKRDRQLVGQIYYQLAVNEWVSQHYIQALHYVRRSIEYFDREQHPLELGRSYLFTVRMGMRDIQTAGLEQYIELALDLWGNGFNPQFAASAWNTKGSYLASLGLFDEARKAYAQSDELNQYNYSQQLNFYYHSNIGRIEIAERKLPAAITELTIANSIEMELRNNIPGLTSILLLAAEGSTRWSDYEELTYKLNHPRNFARANYLLAASKYLYGKSADKTSGEIELTKLVKTSSEPELIYLSEYTLNNQWFGLIV